MIGITDNMELSLLNNEIDIVRSNLILALGTDKGFWGDSLMNYPINGEFNSLDKRVSSEVLGSVIRRDIKHIKDVELISFKKNKDILYLVFLYKRHKEINFSYNL